MLKPQLIQRNWQVVKILHKTTANFNKETPATLMNVERKTNSLAVDMN